MLQSKEWSIHSNLMERQIWNPSNRSERFQRLSMIMIRLWWARSKLMLHLLMVTSTTLRDRWLWERRYSIWASSSFFTGVQLSKIQILLTLLLYIPELKPRLCSITECISGSSHKLIRPSTGSISGTWASSSFSHSSGLLMPSNSSQISKEKIL